MYGISTLKFVVCLHPSTTKTLHREHWLGWDAYLTKPTLTESNKLIQFLPRVYEGETLEVVVERAGAADDIKKEGWEAIQEIIKIVQSPQIATFFSDD